MKTDNPFIKSLFWIILILSLLAAGWWIKSHFDIQEPPKFYQKEIDVLKVKLRKSDSTYQALLSKEIDYKIKIDSLDLQLTSVKKKQVYQVEKVKEVIAADSSEALNQNRQALNELGIKTSNTPMLTNFEMGWNAVFLIENVGLKLQIKNYDSQIFNYNKRINLLKQAADEREYYIDNLDSLKTIYHLNADYYKAEYDKTQEFLYDRIILYGGYGIGPDGLSYQVGIGIKFWGLK